MVWNRKKSLLPFENIEQKVFHKPKLVYWLARNSTPTTKWAVLMHQYGGNSQYMVKQGKIYAKLGFNILFIDGRSHGLSQITKESTAAFYGWDLIKILQYENIKDVFLHGVSFGGIGILIATRTWPEEIFIRGIVVEAICKDVKNIYKHLLEYSPIPYRLYSWFPDFMRKKRSFFDWEANSLDLLLSKLTCPVLIVHSELDSLYKPEIHFEANKKAITNNPNGESWLAPGMLHSHMNEHPDWERVVTEFVAKYV